MGRTWAEHVVHISCSECQNKNKKQFVFSPCAPCVMNNLFLYCGLVDAKIGASDNYSPVRNNQVDIMNM